MRKLLPLSVIFALLTASMNAQTGSDPVHFNDIRFFNALCGQGVDQNEDGIISYDEAAALRSLDISIEDPWNLTADLVHDIAGIEAFVNLETLDVRAHLINKLELSNLTKLEYLDCEFNLINELDVSKSPDLRILKCNWNLLEELDVSWNPKLEMLSMQYNSVSTIDVTKNTALKYFASSSVFACEEDEKQACCRYNPRAFKSMCMLDVTENQNLKQLYIGGSDMREIDISENTGLKSLTLIGFSGDVYTWWSKESGTSHGVNVNEIDCGEIHYIDCVIPLLEARAGEDNFIHASSSEDGTLFLVPEGTAPVFDVVSEASRMSTPVMANSVVEIQVPDGNYWLYAGDGSGNMSEKWEYKARTISIKDFSSESLYVYPNPAGDHINVLFDGNGPVYLELISLYGQRVMSGTLDGNNTTIRLEEIPRGIYMLRLSSDGLDVSRKVIKQ